MSLNRIPAYGAGLTLCCGVWACSMESPGPGPSAMDHRAADPGVSARAAAVAGLQDMLALYRKAPEAFPAGCPFRVKTLAELSTASIGPGFEIQTIDPRRLLAGRGTLAGMTEPSGLWDFPVLVAGRPVALMEVGTLDGTWRAMAAGGAELAAEVHALARRFGGTFRFLRSYEAVADLLEFQDDQHGTRYAPLAATRSPLLQPLAEGRELIPMLQAAVRANAADHR